MAITGHGAILAHHSSAVYQQCCQKETGSQKRARLRRPLLSPRILKGALTSVGEIPDTVPENKDGGLRLPRLGLFKLRGDASWKTGLTGKMKSHLPQSHGTRRGMAHLLFFSPQVARNAIQ